MPLILKQNIGTATLLLWRITETESRLRTLLTAGDLESAAALTSPRRRLERLAWRAALREVEPKAEVMYGETGAPYLSDTTVHIGVAHTRGLAAVIVSPTACAVDAEPLERDFSKAAGRFISPAESRFTDAARPDFPAAVWCAKETMYKLSGRRELDLIRDIEIVWSDIANGKMKGSVMGREVILNVKKMDDYIITFSF